MELDGRKGRLLLRGECRMEVKYGGGSMMKEMSQICRVV